MRHSITQLPIICVMAVAASCACAQQYPDKPLRILASEPGGNVDFVARLIAQGLSASVGQPVIVHNRPSGPILTETALKAPPDGYTLLLQSMSFWITPLMQAAPYDPIKDFTPITLATNAPFFLYVHPSVPAKSVQELIAFAKAKPGALNYGSAGAGTSNHLATELFNNMAGINMVRVPYKGAGPAGVGLVANQVQIMFGSVPLGMSHAKAGRLRVLAVASAQPSILAPEVPTVAASGVPGYESASMSGMWASAKTPMTLVHRLQQEIVRALNQPDAKEKFLVSGIEPLGTTPEQTVAYIKSDVAKWGKLIKDVGIRSE